MYFVVKSCHWLWLPDCFSLQLPSSLSQKLGTYVPAPCFHGFLKDMKKGAEVAEVLTGKQKVWLMPFFFFSYPSHQTPPLHSMKKIANNVNDFISNLTFFLPNELCNIKQKGMKKTPLHLCVYISVYIGALWCIYFCFSWSVLFMCCSGICIGQALVLQTPKFYISPV